MSSVWRRIGGVHLLSALSALLGAVIGIFVIVVLGVVFLLLQMAYHGDGIVDSWSTALIR